VVKLHDVYTEMPGTNGVGDAYLIFEHPGRDLCRMSAAAYLGYP
jgi:hypothetical protein